jgi:hypothetical protein
MILIKPKVNIKLPTCPICKETISIYDRAVIHTSDRFCPKKFIGKYIHSKCAIDNGINVPPDDKEFFKEKILKNDR